MTKEEFLLLYDKCQSGQCSAAEIEKLTKYKDEFELKKLPWIPEMGDQKEVKDALLNSIYSQIKTNSARGKNLFIRWAVAASMLLAISVGLLLLKTADWKQSNAGQKIAKQKLLKSVINPGGNKAVLILANGNIVNLDGTDKGVLSTQGAEVLNGKLIYKKCTGSNNAEQIAYNTIATPRGGQYQITLSDGTRVWLNAASSLRFPVAFGSKERRVKITGEAYFEVAKNRKKPFKVTFNDQEIEVLGTHFNVAAYEDEPDCKTTLLEGSVKISRHGKQEILVPGQQAVSAKSQDNFTINRVDLQDVIAWKNGFFQFHNASLTDIMRQVSRWYDVEVIYEKGFSPQEYGGRVAKYKNISELLSNLELTGTVHFKIDGRRITVMK